MEPTIALLTDFGIQDTYVGVMKAVIRRICPQVEFIDLTHAIPPQNVRAAALALLSAYTYFPSGTVFLVIVDPGVGTIRRPVTVAAGDYFFVAPDNGVLSYTLAELAVHRMVELTNPDYQLQPRSYTFHGRDVFAPAAGYLAAGIELDLLGTPVDTLVQLRVPELAFDAGIVKGEVMHVDHFGNVITSIGELTWIDGQHVRLQPRFASRAIGLVEWSANRLTVTVKNARFTGLKQSYGMAAQGEALALVGSSGFLELAVNQGNCAKRFEVKPGDPVEMRIV